MSPPSEGLAGSAIPGGRDQSDPKAGEARWSYSFVNLKCDVRICPGGLGYHNCRAMYSVWKPVDQKDKKASHDSCRIIRRKAHTSLSAQK